jgi:phytoene dehydrogenase-like protein
MPSPSYDAVVVGAGPNGLLAAVTLAREGRSVLVVETRDTVGGGSRSAELTLPGFVSDVCAAIHPLAASSPYFKALPLERHGLQWVQPELPLVHPLDDGSAGVLHRALDDTASELRADGNAWRGVVGAAVEAWPALVDQFMDPLRVPRRPISLAKVALLGIRSAKGVVQRFETEQARALFAGVSAHAFLPLDHPVTAAFGILLGASGHAVGWPVARGGSQAIVDALAAHFAELGGTVETGRRVRRLSELPPSRATLLDVTPGQLVAMASDRLPARYRAKLQSFRHGPAAFKVDYALDGPVPWTNEACRRAGTVHLGGTFVEVAAAEAAVKAGRVPDRPFTLVAQQSLFDPSRAPQGRHVLWSYCHAPAGCTLDLTDRVTAQIERFAPGFRDRVLAVHSMGPAQLEDYNPNYVGGDIGGGAHDGLQLLARPVLRLRPHRTPLPGVFLCSASTRPGGGVHGACGHLAARAALRAVLR